MEIDLLAFASISDVIGQRELRLELPDRISVGGLKAHLESLHPELSAHWNGAAVAVNGGLAEDNRELRSGDEVALLPPVSGGSPQQPHLTSEAIDVSAAVRLVERPSCGAVVVFVGNVRDSHRGRRVESLSYTAYRSMAETRLATIETDLESAFDGLRAAIVHRLGDLAVGEASVVIATASPHRAEAYEASRKALERLKAEVPIWKKEHYVDGEESWREEESLVSASGSGKSDQRARRSRAVSCT